MTTQEARTLVNKMRENLHDEDWVHDQDNWPQVVRTLVNALDEFVWLREESES